jgi:hypothetical protein
MPDLIRDDFTATLQGVEVGAAPRGGDKTTYKVLRAGMKFPDYITRWPSDDPDDEGPPQLTNGHIYKWIVDKKAKDDSGTKFWLNFVYVESPSERPQRTPTEAHTAPPAKGPVVVGVEDPTATRIARSVALKAAVELACARGWDGADTVIAVAKAFMTFLEPPLPPPAAQEPNTLVDPLQGEEPYAGIPDDEVPF